MNPSVSVKNRSLRDSSRMRTRTRTRNGSMDACLSFTTVSIFTDTYTDHGHGSQFTDLWMASLRSISFSTQFFSCIDHTILVETFYYALQIPFCAVYPRFQFQTSVALEIVLSKVLLQINI